MTKENIKERQIFYYLLIGTIVLACMSLAFENLKYLLVGFLVVSVIFLDVSKSVGVLAFSLPFKSCFGNRFLLYLVLMLIVIAFKSVILFREKKWDNKPKVFRRFIVLFSLYLLIAPFINSLFNGRFNINGYALILLLILTLLTIYFASGNVDLKVVSSSLVWGLVASSVLSIAVGVTGLISLKSVFFVDDSFCFTGLMGANTDLVLMSIIALIFLTFYCLNNKKTMSYVYFLPIVLIGLLTVSKLFIVLLLISLVVLSLMILLNKNSEKGALTLCCVFTVSIVVLVLFFAILFKDELNLFSLNSWKEYFKSYKINLTNSWDLIKSSKKILLIGAPLNNTFKVKTIKNTFLSLMFNLGIVGLCVLCLMALTLLCHTKIFKNKSFVLALVLFLIFSMFVNAYSATALLIFCVFGLISDDFKNENIVTYKEEICAGKYGLYCFLKRTFDVVVSFTGIVVLAIPMLLLLIIIRVFSKIPPIIGIKRVGKDGKIFTLYKFRSMFVDAESRLEFYLTKEQIEIWKRERKIENDPRITKIGKFIRKTSLDELPQLFNILKGDLSIVGNRPLSQMEYDTHFSAEDKKVLDKMRPGLTGYWQVYGRSNVTFLSGERQRMYLYYPKHASVWLDIKIFFKTIIVVLTRKGAK